MRHTPHRRRPHRHSRRSVVESLEARTLLSASQYDPSLFASFAAASGQVQFPSDSVTDAQGNLYITGGFDGTIDFDPSAGGVFDLHAGAGIGRFDVYVAKYTPAGALLWAKQFTPGTPSGAMGDAVIAVAPNGTSYLAFAYTTHFDADPGNGRTILRPTAIDDVLFDVALIKLDAGGNFVTARRVATSNQDSEVVALKIDGAGNLHLAATSEVPNSVFTTPTGEADRDALLYGFDANLGRVYAMRWGVAGHDTDPTGLAVDTAGNAYVTGNTFTGADFAPSRRIVRTVPDTRSDHNGFLLRVNAAGKLDWVIGASVGRNLEPEFYSVTTDPTGDAYLTGKFHPGVDFNPLRRRKFVLATYANRSEDGFVARYSPRGKLDDAWRLSDVGDMARPDRIVYDPVSRHLLVAGSLTTQPGDPVTPGRLVSQGEGEIFLASFTTAGAFVTDYGFHNVDLNGIVASVLSPTPSPDGTLYLYGRTRNTTLPLGLFDNARPDVTYNIVGMFLLALT